MSGARQPDEDSEFSEDFVLEDAAPAADLSDLFTGQPATVQSNAERRRGSSDDLSVGIPGGPEGGETAADTDDFLFVDHTDGVTPSEQFGSTVQFQEGGGSWDGGAMSPEQIGIPVEDAPFEEASAKGRSPGAGSLDGAFASTDEDFGIDSDQELQLVDDEAELLASNAPQSGEDLFLLDDGSLSETEFGDATVAREVDGAARTDDWMPAEVPAEASSEPVAAEASCEGSADTESSDEDWQPLAGPSSAPAEFVAAEAEPAAGDEDSTGAPFAGDEPAEPEFTEPELTEQELAAAESAQGAEEPAPASASARRVASAAAPAATLVLLPGVAPIEAGRRRRRSRLHLVASLAAAALLVGCAATFVVYPELFGLRLVPELVQRVQVDRPVVAPPPVAPALPSPEPVAGTPDPTGVGEVPPPSSAGEALDPQTAPVSTPPDQAMPDAVSPPAAVAGDPESAPDPIPAAGEPTPPVDPRQPLPLTALVGGSDARPLPGGDNLLIGSFTADRGPVAATVAGVAPGSKAFVQLQNGNYFLGRVKSVGKENLTLSLERGEVTLPMAMVIKLAALGSDDYNALQQGVKGSVLLNNNSRLVGAILESIADDYVEIAIRSNRILLPRSAVGKVVQASPDPGVRFDLGRDEQQWLEQMAARQLEQERAGAQILRGKDPGGKPTKPVVVPGPAK